MWFHSLWSSRPSVRNLLGFSCQRHTIRRQGRWARPQMDVLEDRRAPAVQLLYTGPGSNLNLTELVSGATPTVTTSRSPRLTCSRSTWARATPSTPPPARRRLA
jgi:hypothetical protein